MASMSRTYKEQKMMNAGIFKRIFMIIFIALMCGCGTLGSLGMGKHRVYTSKEEYGRDTCGIGQPYIYSGVVFDARSIAAPLICKHWWETDKGREWYPIVWALSIIDLPLSFAADTILLPGTTYLQIKYGNMAKYKEED